MAAMATAATAVGAKATFEFTHVEYEHGDFLGFLCAGLSLAPVFACVAYVSVVLARREFIAFAALAGQLGDMAFNKVLKHRVFVHPRPPACHLTGPGMPSSHSQFVFFTATFWALHAYNAAAVRFSPQTPAWRATLYRHGIAAGLVAAATGVAFSRVYLGYHYTDQVVVGSAFGLVSGVAWYALVQQVLRPLFQACGEDSALCRLLYIRDSQDVPNIVGVEYEATRSRARQLRASGGAGGAAAAARAANAAAALASAAAAAANGRQGAGSSKRGKGGRKRKKKGRRR